MHQHINNKNMFTRIQNRHVYSIGTFPSIFPLWDVESHFNSYLMVSYLTAVDIRLALSDKKDKTEHNRIYPYITLETSSRRLITSVE